MEINKENIKKAIDMLDNVSKMVNYREMEMAVFMWCRYGELLGTEEQLKKINKILEDSETLFDDYILQDVEDVFNEDVELSDDEIVTLSDYFKR
jgi:hypothetical protein